MTLSLRSYGLRIFCLFALLLVLYLGVAYSLYAPRGYYGKDGKPSFSDPWLERSETIWRGGLLYRDVNTTTPPLTNYLMVIPSAAAKITGYRDPWTTLSFMLFFSVFCLLSAFVLFHMSGRGIEGWHAAALFLLNPLTFGNAVLRRQDESILVFFVGLAVLLVLKKKHVTGAISIGTAMLVKLGAIVLIPIAFLHSLKWRYIVVPLLVFIVVVAPFLMLCHQEGGANPAVFWSAGKRHNEHLFQFGGVGLVHMYNAMHNEIRVDVVKASALLVAGALAAIGLVAWKRFGVVQDLAILLSASLMLSPKLHTGYLSLLAFLLAVLVKRPAAVVLYLVFGLTAMTADFCKYPIRDYGAAFWLMLCVGVLLAAILAMVIRRSETTEQGI